MNNILLCIYLVGVFASINVSACPKCLGLKEKEIFIASSGISFVKLINDSMHLMDGKMKEVDLKGKNEKIFLEMMIAHHQGALDMANSILVHSDVPTMQNYARSIISSQYNEILYMQTLLKSYK